MTRHSLTLFALLTIAATTQATACEPVLPFLRVAGGAATLSGSLVVLAVAVTVKCFLFGAFQKRLSFMRGATFMFLGNILTTIIGFLAAGLIGAAPAAFFIFAPIVWALCLPAARRMTRAAPAPWIARKRPGSIAALMTVALIASCILFIMAQGTILSNRLTLYWPLKIAAMYLALLVSITLTAFWEEWTVWRLSRSEPTDSAFVQPAIRSNLIVFFGIALYGAIVIFPSRLKSADFLVGALTELKRILGLLLFS